MAVETATLEVTTKTLMLKPTFSIQVPPTSLILRDLMFEKWISSPYRRGVGGGAHAGVCGISAKAS